MVKQFAAIAVTSALVVAAIHLSTSHAPSAQFLNPAHKTAITLPATEATSGIDPWGREGA
jgi:hypothetical protein